MANPVMSMWLSAANAWAGAMRGFWTAELHRQQTATMNEMLRQSAAFWSGAWLLPVQRPAKPNLSLIQPQPRRASRS
ncbi:MAG TPA: hypothetical protein VE684_10115 [Crenalkalicoccus sp.]|nr:hypothetical protein [Crenalkalicoccus sp.]